MPFRSSSFKMQSNSLLSLLFLHFGLGLAFHQHVKQGGETNATLSVYGANSTDWPIAYGLDDGKSRNKILAAEAY